MAAQNARNSSRREGTGLVRVLNEQAVVETILHAGEISRPGIARETGLSLPTVTSLVDSLESIGLVKEQRVAYGSVGRPAALYALDPQAGYVFAINLGPGQIRAGITDLFGEIAVQRVEATERTSAESIINQLARLYNTLLTESGFDDGAAGVACLGVPGVWNPETDRIGAAPNLPMLTDIPLQASIQAALGLPLTIENDVNLAAIAEYWKGNARGHDTFVSFFISTGIGLGIVIDGEIYHGNNGAAGEIGLLPIGADPFDPALRPHGPFENSASEPSFYATLRAALADGAASTLTAEADIDRIIAAAEAGDALAVTILDDEARKVAVGVATVVAVLDPSLVILGGEVGAHTELARAVYQYADQLIPWMPPMEISALGENATFYGAIALGLPAARSAILIETRT